MKVSLGALCALSLSTLLPRCVDGIDTVPSLDVKKYVGRWYQVRAWVRGSGERCCRSLCALCAATILMCKVTNVDLSNTAATFNFASFFARSATAVPPALRQRVHVQDHEGHYLHRCRLWSGESTEHVLPVCLHYIFMSEFEFLPPHQSLVFPHLIRSRDYAVACISGMKGCIEILASPIDTLAFLSGYAFDFQVEVSFTCSA